MQTVPIGFIFLIFITAILCETASSSPFANFSLLPQENFPATVSVENKSRQPVVVNYTLQGGRIQYKSHFSKIMRIGLIYDTKDNTFTIPLFGLAKADDKNSNVWTATIKSGDINKTARIHFYLEDFCQVMDTDFSIKMGEEIRFQESWNLRFRCLAKEKPKGEAKK